MICPWIAFVVRTASVLEGRKVSFSLTVTFACDWLPTTAKAFPLAVAAAALGVAALGAMDGPGAAPPLTFAKGVTGIAVGCFWPGNFPFAASGKITYAPTMRSATMARN